VVAQADSNGLVAAMTKVGVPVLVEPSAEKLADAYTQLEQLGQATGLLALHERLTVVADVAVAAEFVGAAGGSTPTVTVEFAEAEPAPLVAVSG
jgi:iron complex transport system substrate-binding protein